MPPKSNKKKNNPPPIPPGSVVFARWNGVEWPSVVQRLVKPSKCAVKYLPIKAKDGSFNKVVKDLVPVSEISQLDQGIDTTKYSEQLCREYSFAIRLAKTFFEVGSERAMSVFSNQLDQATYAQFRQGDTITVDVCGKTLVIDGISLPTPPTTASAKTSKKASVPAKKSTKPPKPQTRINRPQLSSAQEEDADRDLAGRMNWSSAQTETIQRPIALFQFDHQPPNKRKAANAFVIPAKRATRPPTASELLFGNHDEDENPDDMVGQLILADVKSFGLWPIKLVEFNRANDFFRYTVFGESDEVQNGVVSSTRFARFVTKYAKAYVVKAQDENDRDLEKALGEAKIFLMEIGQYPSDQEPFEAAPATEIEMEAEKLEVLTLEDTRKKHQKKNEGPALVETAKKRRLNGLKGRAAVAGDLKKKTSIRRSFKAHMTKKRKTDNDRRRHENVENEYTPIFHQNVYTGELDEDEDQNESNQEAEELPIVDRYPDSPPVPASAVTLEEMKSFYVRKYFDALWDGEGESERHAQFFNAYEYETNEYNTGYDTCCKTSGFLSENDTFNAFDFYFEKVKQAIRLPRMPMLRVFMYISEVMIPDAVDVVLKAKFDFDSETMDRVRSLNEEVLLQMSSGDVDQARLASLNAYFNKEPLTLPINSPPKEVRLSSYRKRAPAVEVNLPPIVNVVNGRRMRHCAAKRFNIQVVEVPSEAPPEVPEDSATEQENIVFVEEEQ